MKRVTITFDYEGIWGMPHKVEYDLRTTTDRMLQVLRKHGASAVFFTSGKLVEEHPDIVKAIHDAGHEIGLHGYTHEHMHDLSNLELTRLLEALKQVSDRVEEIIGVRPQSFRSPYLMGPKFYDHRVYAGLASIGIKWISNREIRMPEELFRPDRIMLTSRLWPKKFVYKAMLVAMNPQLVLHETMGDHKLQNAKWLATSQRPFARPEGLMEFPLYSPLDCDLLGMPQPASDSDPRYISYALRVLGRCYDRSREYFNLSCHDWIIGTGNRVQILDRMLAKISADPDAVYWTPSTISKPVGATHE